MKNYIKPKYKKFIFRKYDEGLNDYCGKLLYGESPIHALVKFYNGREYGDAQLWDHIDFDIKLHFFPDKGKVRCNAEIHSDNKLREVHCWVFPYTFSKKNWNKWKDYWFIVKKM